MVDELRNALTVPLILMRKSITSLTQAQEEVEQLAQVARQFSAMAEDFNQRFDALDRFLTGLLGPSVKSSAEKVQRPAPATLRDSGLRAVSHTPAPPTVAERVLYIMRDIGKPVLPKEIARHYLLRDWPLPKNGTIYNLISGTVAYLYLRKKVLVRTQDGYSLPHGDIAKLMKNPVLRQAEGVRAKRRAEKNLAASELPLQEEQPAAS